MTPKQKRIADKLKATAEVIRTVDVSRRPALEKDLRDNPIEINTPTNS